jgi:predicted nucleic acid-binding protein
MSKQFIDTNIIVYANDAADPAKQKRAIEVVASLMRSGEGVISTQVLMEYAAVAVSKLGQPVGAIDRQLFLLERLEIVQVTRELIQQGLDLSESFRLSFWDGVILAAAVAARCDVLLSEDLSAGRKYAGVAVRNPFGG